MADNDILVADFEEEILPSKTWHIDFDRNVITSFIDDLDAIRQTAVLTLATERYEFNIYSNQYGVELMDLFGENMQYVMSEIKRRVDEALRQDDRVTGVGNFEFTRDKRTLHVKFTVTSTAGNFNLETEVGL